MICLLKAYSNHFWPVSLIFLGPHFIAWRYWRIFISEIFGFWRSWLWLWQVCWIVAKYGNQLFHWESIDLILLNITFPIIISRSVLYLLNLLLTKEIPRLKVILCCYYGCRDMEGVMRCIKKNGTSLEHLELSRGALLR